MAVARIRLSHELEAPHDFQARMSRQIPYVPQRVRLAFEQRDYHRAALSDQHPADGREKLDQQLLVEAHLPIDIRALSPDVREVEQHHLEKTPAARPSQCFVRPQFPRVHLVHHALPLIQQLLHVALGLRRVLLQQRRPAVVTRRRHVTAPVVLQQRHREREVAFAHQQDAALWRERDGRLRVGFVRRMRFGGFCAGFRGACNATSAALEFALLRFGHDGRGDSGSCFSHAAEIHLVSLLLLLTFQSERNHQSPEMATSRLRRAIQYPEENEDSPDELDEEHQESLIAALQRADAQKSSLYRKLFLSIPLAAALFFVYALLFTSRTAQQRLLALLSVTSLLSTSYILQYLPVQTPDRKGKKPVYQLEAARGPVERYIVYLNAALAGLLVLVSAVSWWKGLRERAWKEALPGIVMGLTMVVRELLAPLDLEDLQRAKYDYKGA
nr:hypothetical protein CFP56_67027 [Quercus suber]